MKATDGRPVSQSSEAPKEERRGVLNFGDVPEDGHPDELVMVMFPRVSWDAFQVIAKRHGTSTGDAINTALKLLEAAIEQEKGS